MLGFDADGSAPEPASFHSSPPAEIIMARRIVNAMLKDEGGAGAAFCAIDPPAAFNAVTIAALATSRMAVVMGRCQSSATTPARIANPPLNAGTEFQRRKERSTAPNNPGVSILFVW